MTKNHAKKEDIRELAKQRGVSYMSARNIMKSAVPVLDYTLGSDTLERNVYGNFDTMPHLYLRSMFRDDGNLNALSASILTQLRLTNSESALEIWSDEATTGDLTGLVNKHAPVDDALQLMLERNMLLFKHNKENNASVESLAKYNEASENPLPFVIYVVNKTEPNENESNAYFRLIRESRSAGIFLMIIGKEPSSFFERPEILAQMETIKINLTHGVKASTSEVFFNDIFLGTAEVSRLSFNKLNASKSIQSSILRNKSLNNKVEVWGLEGNITIQLADLIDKIVSLEYLSNYINDPDTDREILLVVNWLPFKDDSNDQLSKVISEVREAGILVLSNLD